MPNVVVEAAGAAIASSVLLGYLSEEARTNNCLWNRDFTNAAWVKTTMTVALDQTGIDGAANSASSLLATGANSTVKQTITIAAVNRPFSVYMKRITGSGAIQLAQDGATYTTQTLTTSWTRFTLVASQLNPILSINIVTSGDKIAVDYAALEDHAGGVTNNGAASAPIATTTVAVTRNADVLSFPPSGNISNAAGTAYAEAAGVANNSGRVIGDSALPVEILGLQGGNACQFYDGTTVTTTVASGSAGAAHKLAASWGSATQNAFIDGANKATGAYAGTISSGNIVIGSQAGTSYWLNGTIRNVKLWTVALADSQIAGL